MLESVFKWLLIGIAVPVFGCMDLFRTVGPHPLSDETKTGTLIVSADAGALSPRFDGGITAEKAALSALIAQKNQEMGHESGTVEVASSNTSENVSIPIDIPTAPKNAALTSRQCLAALKKHNVPFERPGFKTPLIDTPVLLSGPIADVQIGPHFKGKTRPTNAVMDCRLALAMVAVAHIAKSLGVEAIEFYSVYRPLKAPPKVCPKRKGRKKCLKKRRQYRDIVKKQKSQHRFGRAIDIRWFKMADGRTIDVLADFDRRDRVAPCSYRPNTPEAELLSTFVCRIHHRHLFNVMLTPNANRDHHNHFHFDITPKARFNILR